MFKNFVYYIIVLLFLYSCTSHREPIEPSIILEGWIENDGHPMVMLHNSVVLGEQYDSITDLFMEKVITLGKVVVSDGDESVILTGSLDTMYMLPYKYTSTHIRGEVGNRYTIELEYEDKIVTATTTIPELALFDSLKIHRTQHNDTLLNLFGYVTDKDVNKEEYYVLFYRYRGERQYINCFLGVFSDADADDRGVITMPIYRNVSVSLRDSISDKKQTRFFKPWDKIDLKLTTVDSVGYRFWSEYSALSNTSSIAFMPVYTNIYTNIEGGKGYWIGYGAKVYPLTLRRDTTIRYPH